MPIRPASSTCSALMNPCPSTPSSWFAGTRQLSKITSLVSLARMPSLFSFLPARKPRRPLLDDEGGDAAVALGPVGHRGRDDHVAGPAVRDELLRAVDDPAHRPRGRPSCASPPRRCRTMASVRPHAASFSPRGQRHQVRLPLFLGAEHEDVRRAEAVVRGDRQADRRVDAGELLDAEAVVHRRTCRRRRIPRETESPSSPDRRTWRAARAGTAAPRPTP